MIDLVALQSLLGVAEQGSVGGAAERLGYTPSAVSQQIKRLERDLGVELLERVGRGVVLTEPARLLVTEGRRLLDDFEGVQARLELAGADLHGTIRMAAHATSIRGIVAPALARLRHSAPDLGIRLVERDPAEGVDLVVSGQADIAVVHNWVGVPLHVPSSLEVAEVGRDIADVLVHRDSPLARRRRVTPAQLVEQPWAITPSGTICHAWFVHMFAGFPRPPEVRYWSPEFATHVSLVAEGLAVALVPRMGRGVLPDSVVAVAVIDPVPTRQILVVRRASMTSSRALKHITEALATVAQDELR